jgi:hypothetical protein
MFYVVNVPQGRRMSTAATYRRGCDTDLPAFGSDSLASCCSSNAIAHPTSHLPNIEVRKTLSMRYLQSQILGSHAPD